MQSTKTIPDLAATEAAAGMMDETEIEYVLHDIRIARELSRRGNQSSLVEHFDQEEEIFKAALTRLHENT